MNQVRSVIPIAGAAIIGLGLGVAGTMIYLSSKSLKSVDQSQYWTSVGAMGTWVGSLVTVIGVAIAAWSFHSQVQQNRKLLEVETLWKLTGEFDSNQMQEVRAHAANHLKGGKTDVNGSVDRVLDFFEQVALVEQRGAISTWFVWHAFYHWIFHYYHLTKDYRSDARTADGTVWEDFDDLYKKITEHQEHKLRHSPTSPTASEMDGFLDDEMRLVQHSQ